MAKKSKASPIVNGLNNEHIIEKSRPLMLMRDVPFTLGELKVLDTYISRINARDDTHFTVRFSKEEYEQLMGIERMRPERLNKYIIQLQGRVIAVPDKTARKGWRNYNLFDESEFAPDDNGQWWVDLSCTPKAKKLFFNIDGVGYLRYQLANVINLTSKYSVLLYCYLLDNRFRKSWEIPLVQFQRDVLRVTSDFYLSSYKDFRKDILVKALAEVNEKTDIEFTVSQVKAGRSVVALRWELVKDGVLLPEPAEVSPKPPQISGQMTFDDVETALNIGSAMPNTVEDMMAIASILPKEFTIDQIALLYSLACKWIPYDPDDPMPRSLRAANWIEFKVKLMNAQQHPVKNRFSWLKKACEGNWS